MENIIFNAVLLLISIGGFLLSSAPSGTLSVATATPRTDTAAEPPGTLITTVDASANFRRPIS